MLDASPENADLRQPSLLAWRLRVWELQAATPSASFPFCIPVAKLQFTDVLEIISFSDVCTLRFASFSVRSAHRYGTDAKPSPAAASGSPIGIESGAERCPVKGAQRCQAEGPSESAVSASS